MADLFEEPDPKRRKTSGDSEGVLGKTYRHCGCGNNPNCFPWSKYRNGKWSDRDCGWYGCCTCRQLKRVNKYFNVGCCEKHTCHHCDEAICPEHVKRDDGFDMCHFCLQMQEYMAVGEY